MNAWQQVISVSDVNVSHYTPGYSVKYTLKRATWTLQKARSRVIPIIQFFVNQDEVIAVTLNFSAFANRDSKVEDVTSILMNAFQPLAKMMVPVLMTKIHWTNGKIPN